MRPDTRNARHRLWFWFGVVGGAKAGQRVLLSVVNFNKGKSLYTEGMTPLVRSLPSRPAWERLPASSVFYYRSPRHRGGHVLAWLFQFDLDAGPERYEFAYCYPYSYTHLQRRLHSLDRAAHEHAAAAGAPPWYARELPRAPSWAAGSISSPSAARRERYRPRAAPERERAAAAAAAARLAPAAAERPGTAAADRRGASGGGRPPRAGASRGGGRRASDDEAPRAAAAGAPGAPGATAAVRRRHRATSTGESPPRSSSTACSTSSPRANRSRRCCASTSRSTSCRCSTPAGARGQLPGGALADLNRHWDAPHAPARRGARREGARARDRRRPAPAPRLRRRRARALGREQRLYVQHALEPLVRRRGRRRRRRGGAAAAAAARRRRRRRRRGRRPAPPRRRRRPSGTRPRRSSRACSTRARGCLVPADALPRGPSGARAARAGGCSRSAPPCYTLEVSFFAATSGAGGERAVPYTPERYAALGRRWRRVVDYYELWWPDAAPTRPGGERGGARRARRRGRVGARRGGEARARAREVREQAERACAAARARVRAGPRAREPIVPAKPRGRKRAWTWRACRSTKTKTKGRWGPADAPRWRRLCA